MLCLLGHSSYTLDAGVLWEGQYILPRKWCCTSHTVSSCSMHSITILGSPIPSLCSSAPASLEGVLQHDGRKAQVSLTSQTHSTSGGLLMAEPKLHTVVFHINLVPQRTHRFINVVRRSKDSEKISRVFKPIKRRH